jgi:hypothetical protein
MIRASPVNHGEDKRNIQKKEGKAEVNAADPVVPVA